MTLYKMTNGLGDYWVVAEDPTEGKTKLEAILDEARYGFSKDREVKNIAIIAEKIENSQPLSLTGKFLLLI